MKIGETWIVKNKVYKTSIDVNTKKRPKERFKVKITKLLLHKNNTTLVYFKNLNYEYTDYMTEFVFLMLYEKFYD